MKIIINNSSMVPIYEKIMEQIKAQIISGELKENDILLSVRTMAKELKISALTSPGCRALRSSAGGCDP